MIIDILTLFPEMYEGVINSSIIKRAIQKEIVEIRIHDFREFSTKANKRVDDYSYGGGAGMVIEALPVIKCLESIDGYLSAKKLITLPTGYKYDQKKAIELSKEEHIIIICGHYEGIDHRVMNYVDEAVSIGDYILTGGEIASLAIIDSVIRLLPDALGNDESIEIESFDDNLLEYPQYTRPVNLNGMEVPNILVNGNHELIRRWRRYKQLETTVLNRPDLLEKVELTNEDKYYLQTIKNGGYSDEEFFNHKKIK